MDKEWRREEGAVIVVAVFVVLALVIVGSLSSMLSNIERDISRNDKMGKEAFFVADAGNPISTKVLRDMILNEGIDSSDPSYMEYMNKFCHGTVTTHISTNWPRCLYSTRINWNNALLKTASFSKVTYQ